GVPAPAQIIGSGIAEFDSRAGSGGGTGAIDAADIEIAGGSATTGAIAAAEVELPVGIVNVRRTFANRSASWNRSAGFFAHAFSIASSSRGGISLRQRRKSGSGAFT